MKKLFGLFFGLLAGTVIGAIASLVLSPRSLDDVKQDATERWNNAIDTAKQEMEATQKSLQEDFKRKQPK